METLELIEKLEKELALARRQLDIETYVVGDHYFYDGRECILLHSNIKYSPLEGYPYLTEGAALISYLDTKSENHGVKGGWITKLTNLKRCPE